MADETDTTSSMAVEVRVLGRAFPNRTMYLKRSGKDDEEAWIEGSARGLDDGEYTAEIVGHLRIKRLPVRAEDARFVKPT